MIQWLLVRGDQRTPLYRAFGASWGAGTAALALATVGPRPVTIAWAEGARARRAPRWPDVLESWKDFHADPLFPTDPVPVLGEELGASALALAVVPGPPPAVTAVWYAAGAATEYQHLGPDAVAWSPTAGLAHPRDPDPYVTAVHRLLDAAPPPFEELHALVLRAPTARWRL